MKSTVLVLSALIALSSLATIPTTLEPGTAYVVNCETGNAPAKIYVENASLTLENKAHLNFANTTAAATKNGGGTNFLLRVTGGSVVTNYQNVAPTSYSRLLFDEGSVFHIGKSNTYLPSSASAHDITIAVSNSYWNSYNNVHFFGCSNRVHVYNSTFDGSGTHYLKGRDNELCLQGPIPMGAKAINVGGGTNCWLRILDDSQVSLRGTLTLSASVGGTNGVYVGKRSYFYCGSGTGFSCNSRNTRVVVDEDGCLAMWNGDGGGAFGIDSAWITTNGTIAVSNNSYRIACPRNDTVNADKLRVRFELYGPKANVYATTINASSTTYPTNLTVVLRPGADGYTVAPLRGKTVNIYGGIFDIDMREAIQSVEPGEVLRMPIARATSTLNVSDIVLLNQNAKLLPEDAQLVKEGNILYCVARRQKGLMILVR